MIISYMKHTVYISIGSNLNDRVQNCAIAISKLTMFASLLKQSSFYETEPWGYEDDNLYINAVLKIQTELNPQKLLIQLKLIEKEMGRLKKTTNNIYASRVIDLDILFFDQIILNSTNLTIPHIQVHNRNHVLIPFNEIDPEFECPLKKDQIQNLVKLSNDKTKVFIYPQQIVNK
tara:strand:+ start:698 stop:1222 length:525 start_codon:yes stop_codon:yes gene_type:complete